MLLQVRIMPKTATRFGQISVRCQLDGRRVLLQRGQNEEPGAAVAVTSVTDFVIDRQRATGNTAMKYHPEADGAGGISIHYVPINERPAGGEVCLCVMLRAERPWKGYLGVRNLIGGPYEQIAHLPLEIVTA